MTDSARPVCDCPEPCACYAGRVRSRARRRPILRSGAVLDLQPQCELRLRTLQDSPRGSCPQATGQQLVRTV